MQKFSDGQVMSQVYLSCLMFPVMLGEIGQDFRGGGGGACNILKPFSISNV